jgi:hypothetical protein
MPQKKKKLTDVLTIRGRAVSDGTNNTNQRRTLTNNRDDLDAPLNRVPQDVSPADHGFFRDNPDPSSKPKRKRKQFMPGGRVV